MVLSCISIPGMIADREEYLLTDDERLAPENAANPKQHKRYKRSTATTYTDYN